MAELRKLINIEKEINSYLNKIHKIDEEIIKDFDKLTLSNIKDKKRPFRDQHSKISKLRKLISDGEYLEAQEDKLF